MRAFFSLDSNSGDRRTHLRWGLAALQEAGLRNWRVSPVVESPAALPPGAPSAWNLPYLNLVVEGDADGTPQDWQQRLAAIEAAFSPPGPVGAPRELDIDLLLWGTEIIHDGKLVIPHPKLHRHAFALTPLLHLRPRLTLPGLGDKTLLDWSRELNPPVIPLWMWIVNITPDSFSDGGVHNGWERIAPDLERVLAAGVQILDIGAESTRPRATPVTPAEEWARLEPVLAQLASLRPDPLRPLVSIDTRHPETAEKALNWGADIINDVSGLTNPAMRTLARDSGKTWIAMHYLTVPVDPQVLLPPDCDPVAEVDAWILARIDEWQRAGIALENIVIDPGIGFGKSSLQSLQLLRRAGALRRHGLRVLVGHSRKSFLKDVAGLDPQARDYATLGASMQLCAQGVDMIRVHDAVGHVQAYRGWAQLQED